MVGGGIWLASPERKRRDESSLRCATCSDGPGAYTRAFISSFGVRNGGVGAKWPIGRQIATTPLDCVICFGSIVARPGPGCVAMWPPSRVAKSHWHPSLTCYVRPKIAEFQAHIRLDFGLHLERSAVVQVYFTVINSFLIPNFTSNLDFKKSWGGNGCGTITRPWHHRL